MSWKGIEKVFERGLKDIYELTGVRGGAKIGQAESLKVLKHQIAQANWGTASTKAGARQVANNGNGETGDGSEPSGPSLGFRLYLVGNEKSLKVLHQCHVQICFFKKSCVMLMAGGGWTEWEVPGSLILPIKPKWNPTPVGPALHYSLWERNT